eukprot:10691161-Heterocapsa_arctica.AAC.1
MNRAVEEHNLEQAWALLNDGLSGFYVDYRKQPGHTYSTASPEVIQLRHERQQYRVQVITAYNSAIEEERFSTCCTSCVARCN